jgi:hypothetical protein
VCTAVGLDIFIPVPIFRLPCTIKTEQNRAEQSTAGKEKKKKEKRTVQRVGKLFSNRCSVV